MVFNACGSTKYMPTSTNTVIRYRDTTIFKTDTLYLPKETIVYRIPQLDTLVMETSVATCTSYLDTLNKQLVGKLKNKPKLETLIKTQVITRDSIVFKEVPKIVTEIVEKKVIPTWAWYCLTICILELMYIVIKIIIKLKI